eukprot:m.70933 g.70933  ORF g.70933 m.70933 type:complete len:135 (+) comp50160_c0_seq6:1237-1641(+)
MRSKACSTTNRLRVAKIDDTNRKLSGLSNFLEHFQSAAISSRQIVLRIGFHGSGEAVTFRTAQTYDNGDAISFLKKAECCVRAYVSRPALCDWQTGLLAGVSRAKWLQITVNTTCSLNSRGFTHSDELDKFPRQ